MFSLNISKCLKIIQILLLISLTNVCVCDKATSCAPGEYDNVAQEAIFVELTNSSVYKKWMRPMSTKPVLVNVSIEMYSMAAVNERNSEFNINLLIDLEWNDTRLTLDNRTDCKPEDDLTIEGSEWHLDRVWSPKLRVPNNKNPSALDRDAKIILLRVSSSGYVRVRKRLTLDLFCEMDFRYYPLDSQSCNVSFISSDLSTEHLALEWITDDGFTYNHNFYMNGFSLKKIELKSSSHISKKESFSSVTITFNLKRDWTHYILDIYLPTFLIIIVSWISFWMDITQTPARITLGITTMLTFLTVAKESRENLPNISYVNALDIWFVVCTAFIFLSLIEFSVITYISRAEKRKIKQMKTLRRNISQSQISLSSAETQFTYTINDGKLLQTPKITCTDTETRFPFDGLELKIPKSSPNLSERSAKVQMSPKNKRVKLTITPPDSPKPDPQFDCDLQTSGVILKLSPREIAEYIDRKCRIVFPAAFLVFNFVYWLTVSI